MENKILWDHEMIDPEKREVLKGLGLDQLFVHNTGCHFPGMDYSEIPLIPTDTFYTKDKKWEVRYINRVPGEDWFVVMKLPARGMDAQIDDSKKYNWETGLERLKQLLNENNSK